MESLALPLVVHQKIVEGGGRLDGTSVIANAHIASVATAWACGGEAEGGLEAGVEGVAVERGAGHERRALRPAEPEEG